MSFANRNIVVVPRSNGKLGIVGETTALVKPMNIAKVNEDPVPGKIYNASVKNKAGQLLNAAFFYMDSEGQQISQDFDASTGIFHFTVPNYNYQQIFVEIYSTKEYLPVVKTFYELVNEPTVILEPVDKKPGLSTEATISLLGLAVAVAALSKDKRKVGAPGTVYIERFKRQSTGRKVLIVGGVAAGLYFLLKYKPTPEQKEYLKQAQDTLKWLAAEHGIVPSLNKSQFSSMVAVIVKSLDKCGTEEENIFAQFEKLNNEADLYQLIVSFGIANYDGCFEGSLPFWRVNYVLSQALSSDLDTGDINQINDILYNKGLNSITNFSF